MNYYRDKIVYITGGSSGIGYALAGQLLSMGAGVVLFARDRKRLAAAELELSKTGPGRTGKICTIPLDVSDAVMTARAVSSAVKKFGQPDVVINSAGAAFSAPFDSTDEKTFRSIIDVNLLGTVNVARAVLPLLRQRGGTLVNVASMAGLIGTHGYSAYGASKYAVVGLSEVIRLELKPEGVRVKTVCPPEVDTPMVREEAKTIQPAAKRLKVLSGVLTAEETARYILRKIPGRGFFIIPGRLARLTFLTARFFPGLTRTVIDILFSRFNNA